MLPVKPEQQNSATDKNLSPKEKAINEFNHALMRAAQYEGNIENSIFDKVTRLFPDADEMFKKRVIASAVEKIAEANQAFEFNHLGNELLEFPAVEYAARSFLRRILEKVAIAQATRPDFKGMSHNDDAGMGFLEGWSRDKAEWAKQMNALLNESKINARVLTTLAYHHLHPFRYRGDFATLGNNYNTSLMANKEANPRLDIFSGADSGEEPKFGPPFTAQPHGWPWLKYVDWNVALALGDNVQTRFISNRTSNDKHKGKGYKFIGMSEAIKPPLYCRNSFSLSERPDHLSGYGGYAINDKSTTSIGLEQPLVLNWRRQNRDKKLPMFAGPSSTTSYMYEVARLLELPVEEVQAFRLLMLGWMIQPRDHSFTEIMGAFDAYAMEFDDKGPAVVPSDAKMAWSARKSGDWVRAYEDLLTEDIDLPALEAKTIILNGQEIHLPAQKAVHVSPDEFDRFITQGKGYPSQYVSDDYLLKIGKAVAEGQDVEDISGLASEKILYAPQKMDTLELYNDIPRQLMSRPVRTASGTPLLDAEKEAAVTAWLDKLSVEKRTHLLESAASLLAESTQADSVSHVFNTSGRNDIWETFLTIPGTNMLAGRMKLDSLTHGEDPFLHLLDRVKEKKTPQERAQALLDAIGASKENQDILMTGMMLAVTRSYTGNATDMFNPGYGGFAPPKNAVEMEIRLQSVLKKKDYISAGQRTQAKSERSKAVELLHAALKSPLFERYQGTTWHGSHVDLIDAIPAKGSQTKFPGFMSTTYDPKTATSYMDKGGLFVVQPGNVQASLVEGISNAPGEKEALFSEGTLFTVEQKYTLHLEPGYPPGLTSMVKKRVFDTDVEKGRIPPYIKIWVTTPEMGSSDQTDPEGERLLEPLINVIKTKGMGSLEPETNVVVLRPTALEGEDASEETVDNARQARTAVKEEANMLAR